MAQGLFPPLRIDPPAFAMVGMAAVFAVTVSLVISRQLQPDSVYELGLARKGVRLERGRDVEVLEGITVGEVMQSEALPLRESDPLRTASETFMRTRHHGLPVVNDQGALVGIITVQDLDRAQTGNGLSARTVGDICTRDLVVTYPDETIGAALRRMSTRDVGRLPVVSRDHPRQLLGVLRRSDLVRAYDIALTRRAAMRHRAHQVRLGAFSGAEVEEVTVGAGASCAGRRISQVDWPRGCVIATLRRGRHVLIPHGDTVLKAGDVLVAVTEGEAGEGLRYVCAAPGESQNR